MINVVFQPSGRSVKVPKETLLSDALVEAGEMLPLDCGGNGVCGSCQISVEGNTSEPDPTEIRLKKSGKLKDGYRLACRTKALGDCRVEIPEGPDDRSAGWLIDKQNTVSIQTKFPVIKTVSLSAQKPELDDPRSDLARVFEDSNDLKKTHRPKADVATASQLSRLARDIDWRLEGYLRQEELVGIGSAGQAPLGIAVDLGSTKLAAYLSELQSGKILSARGRVNPQISLGADVVTRLQKAISRPDHHKRLTTMIRKSVDELTGELVKVAGVSRSRIAEMSLVGNTVMIHLFAGLPLEQLGAPPFVACMDQAFDCKARELGQKLAPGAYIHMPPSVGGYIGSDNVAMILGSDLDKPGRCRLGLDIGTNTELVLSVPDKPELYITSAPSGPTFEGAHLSSGMRALSGAIGRVRIKNGKVETETVDGNPPAGICGSGAIDALAEMYKAGVLNDKGHLNRDLTQVIVENKAARFALVQASKADGGVEINLTQEDISQVQLAKGAIYAAALSLLDEAGLQVSDLEEVILAGSFGSHIDVDSARCIGLVPDIENAIYRQVGNAAGLGARMLLNDHSIRERASKIASKAHYIELSSKPYFKSAFARSLKFPSLKGYADNKSK